MDGIRERVIRIYSNLDSLAEGAAVYFTEVVNAAVKTRGRALVALSGGGTPYPLYGKLSLPVWHNQIPWKEIHFFWGDERLVPPVHEESNFFQSTKRLLSLVPVPAENVHRVKSELPAGEAAREYASILGQFSEAGRILPEFDLILLGLGEDGHTASLFPGVEYPGENRELVIAVTSRNNIRPAARITFTPRLINAARHICFLVSGTGKAEAAARTLFGEFDPLNNPAQRILPMDGRVVWMIEQNAAILLEDLHNPLEKPSTRLFDCPPFYSK